MKATSPFHSPFRSVALLVVIALTILGLPAMAIPASAFPDPGDEGSANLTLEGCRNNGGIVLPDGTGKFICADPAYTTGNLGKGWNELDLVPHRVTTTTGASDPTEYKVTIMADGITKGKVGYDVISVPEVNDAKSDASCSVSAGPQTLFGDVSNPFGGGTDTVIYRDLTIKQDPRTTCVFDYYERLALGAHLYPGSSLQSYLGSQANLAGSKKTVSIPVNEILPQELRKNMTASRADTNVWNVTKGATPAHLDFTNTCDSAQPLKQGVDITVTWTKVPTAGGVTLITNIYAKNPAARTITVNVTDKIYEGTTQTKQVGADATSGPIDVPANQEVLVLTHTIEGLASTATHFNDVATATYTDKVNPDVPIPGNTTATAGADVKVTEKNGTATINDVESITGTGLKYSVDSFSGATGAFDGGYVAGTKTDANVSWTSSSQSSSGSVTFKKTVYAAKGTIEPNGNLHDVATLTGSDGFKAEADLDVKLTVNTLAELTINKTIPNILQKGESETFTFDVINSKGVVVATPSISFGPGETDQSKTVKNLVPDVYTVHEQHLAHWQDQPDNTADLSGAACVGSVDFNNAYQPAQARVKKITEPAGSEAGWTFTLEGTDLAGNPIAPQTVKTTDANYVAFPNPIIYEGSYTITETEQTGWVNKGGSAECKFSVNFPADGGRTFSCDFTNTAKPAHAQVKKVTKPAGFEKGWTFDLKDKDGKVLETVTTDGTGYMPFKTDLGDGTYSIVEQGQSGWKSDGGSAGCTFTVSLPADRDKTFSCEFTNTYDPSVKITKTGDKLSKIGDDVSYTIKLENTSPTPVGVAGAPDLVCDISDPTIGFSKTVTLAAGATDTSGPIAFKIPEKATDPFPNTATAKCHYSGATDVVASSDSTWNTELFQPGVKIEKSVSPTAQVVGKDVTYTYTITNTGSSDSPNLMLASLKDDVLGDLKADAITAGCDNLAPAGKCTFTKTWTVAATDVNPKDGTPDDPIINTVDVLYHPDGFPNDIKAQATASLNLFAPAVSATKTCDEKSKVDVNDPDTVNCKITITNSGSSDAENVLRITKAVDFLTAGDGVTGKRTLGDLQDSTKTGWASDLKIISTTCLEGAGSPVELASGKSCEINISFQVTAADNYDPLLNNVNVTARVVPLKPFYGYTYTTSASASINLFQPSITFKKTADTALSKVGDPVNYTLTLDNTSSADSPDLVCKVTDTMLGVDKSVTLKSGGQDVTTVKYTVKAGDPDPLKNTASVSCSPVGFPNVLKTDSSWTVNLFQPKVQVDKSGPAYSKAGDIATYKVTITNLSSADSPDLVLKSLGDSLAGDLMAAAKTAGCDVLTKDEVCSFTYEYTVMATDPDPLVNKVAAHYSPTGFPNDIWDDATWNTDLLHPEFSVTKSCLEEPVPLGASASFEVFADNTGDAILNYKIHDQYFALDATNFTVNPLKTSASALNLTFSAGDAYFTLKPGEYVVFDTSRVATTLDPVVNAIDYTITLDKGYELGNTYTGSARAECKVEAQGATRTPGYWKTHVQYTTHVFNVHLGGSMDLGWKTVNSPEQFFGLMWSDLSKNSDGTRRSQNCQACVKGAQTLAVALLNVGLDNGAEVPIDVVTGQPLTKALRDELVACATGDCDRTEIMRLNGLLDMYNNSGDDVGIIDNDGFLQGSADPAEAKSLGKPYFSKWDCGIATRSRKR